MARFFPLHSVQFSLDDPAIERFARRLPAMAITAGVVGDLFLWLAFARRAESSWVAFTLFLTLFLVVVLGATTIYLSNHPVRQWAWRAPVFAGAEALTEVAVRAILTAFGLGRWGSGYETWADFFPHAVSVFAWRLVIILSFTAMLAAVVQLVRYVLLRRDERDSTARAMRDEQVRHAHR